MMDYILICQRNGRNDFASCCLGSLLRDLYGFDWPYQLVRCARECWEPSASHWSALDNGFTWTFLFLFPSAAWKMSRPLQSLIMIFSKQFVELGVSGALGEKVERAVYFDVVGGAEECAPGGRSKGGTDRDAAYAKIGQLGQ
jgi:hypothetical protein